MIDTKPQIPPSIKCFDTGKKFWTQAEIVQIIKLQEYLQRQRLQITASDFIDLWNDSNKLCTITKVPFCTTDKFDVGIERIDRSMPFTKKNARLVLLPISYSTVRSQKYAITIDGYDKIIDKRHDIFRAIVGELIEKVKQSTIYNCGLTFSITASESKNWSSLIVKHTLFPVTRWYRKEEREENTVSFYSLYIYDYLINITNYMLLNMEAYSLSKTIDLNSPDIDIMQTIFDLYERSHHAVLVGKSMKILKEWEY